MLSKRCASKYEPIAEVLVSATYSFVKSNNSTLNVLPTLPVVESRNTASAVWSLILVRDQRESQIWKSKPQWASPSVQLESLMMN